MKKDDIPSGSDVSAGTYRCNNCGYELSVQSIKHLPPCPKCKKSGWKALTGVGDGKKDPYPNKH